MKKKFDPSLKIRSRESQRIIGEISYKVKDVVSGVCEICGDNTYDDPTNIVLGDKIFHFDCILRKIKERFGISEDKKIIYLGSNSFGIFWESKNGRKLELLKKLTVSDIVSRYDK